jgi:GDP/UDP-N,N'-diacetylbacillosamine 2-epimerase (hydrolysing)
MKKNKKNFLIFTGSRADYGILSTLISKIKSDDHIKSFIFAGSDHFSPSYGNTYKEILKDGFKIDFRSNVKILGKYENLSTYCAKILNEYSIIISRLRLDGALILGDRYEAFIFSIVCFFNKIPIFHLHGGELTKGAMDDNLRHSISKFALFHFVTNKVYKTRLMQLGETPVNIFNYGALGDENIKNTKIISRNLLFKKYNIPFNKKIILITFHPETMSNETADFQIKTLLNGLKNGENYFYIFTSNNSDPGSIIFLKNINYFIKKNKNSIIVKSFGKLDYINLLKSVDLMIGNSSSIVLDSPNVNLYAINIGERQIGRIFKKNIIQCKLDSNMISKKIKLYIDKKIKIKIKTNNTSEQIKKRIFKILQKKKNKFKKNIL